MKYRDESEFMQEIDKITIEDFDRADEQHAFSAQFEKNMQMIMLKSAAIQTGRKKRHSLGKLKKRSVAAAVIAALLILGSGAAYATKLAHIDLGSLGFQSYGIDGSDQSQKIVGEMAASLHETVTKSGIKMTADTIVRDGENHFIVVYSLIRTDGTSILPENMTLSSLENSNDGVSPLYFEDYSIHFSSPNTSEINGSSGIFYDENPDEPSIQYMEDLDCSQWHVKNVPENVSILASHKKLILNIQEKKFQYKETELAKGPWNFKLDVPEKTESIHLAENQKFHCDQYGGYDSIIDSLEITPLGVTLRYQIIEDTFTRKQGIDHYVPMDFCIALKNGKTLELPGYQNSGISIGYDERHPGTIPAVVQQYFGKLVPIDEMESITIGDLTVEIPK